MTGSVEVFFGAAGAFFLEELTDELFTEPTEETERSELEVLCRAEDGAAELSERVSVSEEVLSFEPPS